MTTRLLKEDSSLLLAEDGGGFINDNLFAVNDITTPSPEIKIHPVDNSEVNDWYDYFFEPIVYWSDTSVSTVLAQVPNYALDDIETGSPEVGTISVTQDHSLSAVSITSDQPVVDSPTASEIYNLTATGITTSQPAVSQTDLTQDHDLGAGDTTTDQPTVGQPEITGNHSLSVTAILFGQPVVSSAGLIQSHGFQANDLASGQPTLGSPALTETQTEQSLSASGIVTSPPVVGTAELTEVYNLSPEDIQTPFPDVERPVDPNQIVQQEIKEIEQMFGGWPRRAYEVPDGRLVQAEREIEALTGDRVSIDRKAKSLIKFGKSADLVADTLETVWTVGGDETYVTDNTIEYISSSSALDNQTIKLECHTVSGTGADAKFTFLVQEVTLNGQNPVALGTPVARVSHAYNSNGTELVGRVTVYENTTVVGGVPSDATKIHIDIPQGLQGSFKGATTFSDSDYYVLTGGFGSVSKKQAANVDFYLEVREAGGVFIQRAAVSASTGGPWDIELDPAVIVPKNADVRIRADSGTNNAVVFGVFKGYLAKVLN